MSATLTKWWCSLTHGGGIITRDDQGRINWRCSRCGRWSDPVSLEDEKGITIMQARPPEDKP